MNPNSDPSGSGFFAFGSTVLVVQLHDQRQPHVAWPLPKLDWYLEHLALVDGKHSVPKMTSGSEKNMQFTGVESAYDNVGYIQGATGLLSSTLYHPSLQ